MSYAQHRVVSSKSTQRVVHVYLIIMISLIMMCVIIIMSNIMCLC